MLSNRLYVPKMRPHFDVGELGLCCALLIRTWRHAIVVGHCCLLQSCVTTKFVESGHGMPVPELCRRIDWCDDWTPPSHGWEHVVHSDQSDNLQSALGAGVVAGVGCAVTRGGGAVGHGDCAQERSRISAPLHSAPPACGICATARLDNCRPLPHDTVQ